MLVSDNPQAVFLVGENGTAGGDALQVTPQLVGLGGRVNDQESMA